MASVRVDRDRALVASRRIVALVQIAGAVKGEKRPDRGCDRCEAAGQDGSRRVDARLPLDAHGHVNPQIAQQCALCKLTGAICNIDAVTQLMDAAGSEQRQISDSQRRKREECWLPGSGQDGGRDNDM